MDTSQSFKKKAVNQTNHQPLNWSFQSKHTVHVHPVSLFTKAVSEALFRPFRYYVARAFVGPASGDIRDRNRYSSASYMDLSGNLA